MANNTHRSLHRLLRYQISHLVFLSSVTLSLFHSTCRCQAFGVPNTTLRSIVSFHYLNPISHFYENNIICYCSRSLIPLHHYRSSTNLNAKPNKKPPRKSRTNAPTSGFGGAATSSCPCGSSLPYNKCCGLIHNSPTVYANATASQVVRARYSAYATQNIDFIIQSTHPLNKDSMEDIEQWKQNVRENGYDEFELTSCQILSEEDGEDSDSEGAVAYVRFIARMNQRSSREKTAFMETSKFRRRELGGGGPWLYLDGIVEPVEE